MRLHVDPDVCQSNGLCVQVAPDLVQFDDDDRARPTESPLSEAELADARAAVTCCPSRALSIR